MDAAAIFGILFAYVLVIGLGILIWYYLIKGAVRNALIEAAEHERKRLIKIGL